MEHEGPGAPGLLRSRVHIATIPHTLPLTFWPFISGPVLSECFIPSHFHILRKKASLFWTANAIGSFIGGPGFLPQHYKKWMKMLVLAESYTKA